MVFVKRLYHTLKTNISNATKNDLDMKVMKCILKNNYLQSAEFVKLSMCSWWSTEASTVQKQYKI